MSIKWPGNRHEVRWWVVREMLTGFLVGLVWAVGAFVVAAGLLWLVVAVTGGPIP